MGSDAAMASASAPVTSKDIGRKKKNNRSAKLKQCKLDARREQWLAQVKKKGCNVADDHISSSPPSSVSVPRHSDRLSMEKHVMRSMGDENDRPESARVRNHELSINIPIFDQRTNSSEKDSGANSLGSRSSFSGSYSRSTSDADEEGEDEESGGGGGEDGGLDDWEAVADALTTGDDTQSNSIPDNNTLPPQTPAGVECLHDSSNRGILKKPEPNLSVLRAWRPDDAFRPQCLPNLSKQRTFPISMERHCSGGNIGWVRGSFPSQPSSCPICYEDLDLTDSSFLPCSCGFRLCLFCHKRILEADGRCPGCRKEYSPVASGEMLVRGGGAPLLPIRLSHSRSMISRS